MNEASFYRFVVDRGDVSVKDDKLVFQDANLKVRCVVSRESIDWEFQESSEISIYTHRVGVSYYTYP